MIAPHHHKNNTGFTLIELLTTLAIISFLALISYPVYTSYLIKTRRIQAEVTLLNLANELEQYHLLHHTYAGATLSDLQINPYTDNQMYRLVMSSATETSYLLNAYPMKTQKADQLCEALSLNQLGQKMISGNGKALDCW